MAESAIDARPDLETGEATLAPGSGRPRRWSGTDRRILASPRWRAGRGERRQCRFVRMIRAAQRSALPTRPGQRTISGVKLATRQNDRFCAAQTTRLCPYRAVPNNLADQARSAPYHVPQERRDYLSSPVVPRISRRWSSTDSFQGCVRFWERIGSGDRPPTAVRCGQALRSWLFRVPLTCWNVIKQRLWWSAGSVRDEEAAGSNPAIPTSYRWSAACPEIMLGKAGRYAGRCAQECAAATRRAGSQASRRRSRIPPVVSAPPAHRASTPRPAHGLIGRLCRSVVA